MSTLKVDQILKKSGTGTITLGQSGDTLAIPSGATIANSGTATGFGDTNTPNFYVWKEDANQTISHNTNTLITFNDEKFDSDSAYASNKFTVPSGKQGVYFISGQLTWLDPNVDDKSLHVKIYKNGSEYTEASDRSSENHQTVNVSALLSLSAGDYIEIYGRQGSGGNLICTAHITTFFFGFKLT
tara:strand:- start:354 stop:908 length:555 start_codon:yes stop_codon:yes gene_type:complete